MSKRKNIIVPILFLAIIILGFKTSSLQNQVQENELYNTQLQSLLTGPGKVAGYTCGALNTEKAKTILKSVNVNKIFGQGPTDILRDGEPKIDKVFWADSCRYEETSSNAKYVELYISTFQSDEQAKSVFLDFIPEVNDKVVLPPDNYGQELIYDGGVHYLLQDNRIIQVSASNGNPSETENFSRQVFSDLIFSL